MKQLKLWFQRRNDQSGATAVLVAILLVPLLGFLALAVDIGSLTVSRNELQDAADAAALAGARKLGKIYQGDDTVGAVVEPMSYDKQLVYNCSQQVTYSRNGAVDDCGEIVAAAMSAGTKNKVFGSAIAAADVEIGVWPDLTAAAPSTFTKGDLRPNAVFVKVQRSGNINGGAIPTFIAKVLGVQTMSVNAKATASLTGESKSAPGELDLPIGIPFSVFTGEQDKWCQSKIQFSPSTAEGTCGAWTDFGTGGGGVSNDDILALLKGEDKKGNIVESPELTANLDSVPFIGGDLSQGNFEELLRRFQNDGYDVDAQGKARVKADGTPVDPLDNSLNAVLDEAATRQTTQARSISELIGCNLSIIES